MADILGPRDAIEKAKLTDAQLAARVREADVVVLLFDRGQRSASFVRGVDPVPLKWEVSYGEKDDPPLTIRRFQITGGWTQAEWRKLDRSALGDGNG